MDCEPEVLQFLGIGGIYRDACKLILSWRLLFSQIVASLIVPLSLLFLAHIQISHFIFSHIDRNNNALGASSPQLPILRVVWCRLAHTFIFAFFILLTYNLLSILSIISALLMAGDYATKIFIAFSLGLLYLAGLIWISVVWHVASVVLVLEDACGVEAIRRSRELIITEISIIDCY
ncbi:hypothetical protein M5K25_006781 [Dendrobium thyrsiflorum]|uniref:PRA1 family protein n=1 Tax=Dendrobium thyrsiflorum TaxID=117978 RepID=A0ABD0VCP8_DENTH